MAMPVGLGLLVGVFNGLGVACHLRAPAMIFTLGVNVVPRGFMAMLTGGFSPPSPPAPIMLYLAKGDILGAPVPFLIWLAVGAAVTFILQRTPLGRHIHAIGDRQPAVYLSGVNDELAPVASLALAARSLAQPGSLSPAIPRKHSGRWATPICRPRSPR